MTDISMLMPVHAEDMHLTGYRATAMDRDWMHRQSITLNASFPELPLDCLSVGVYSYSLLSQRGSRGAPFPPPLSPKGPIFLFLSIAFNLLRLERHARGILGGI